MAFLNTVSGTLQGGLFIHRGFIRNFPCMTAITVHRLNAPMSRWGEEGGERQKEGEGRQKEGEQRRMDNGFQSYKHKSCAGVEWG